MQQAASFLVAWAAAVSGGMGSAFLLMPKLGIVKSYPVGTEAAGEIAELAGARKTVEFWFRINGDVRTEDWHCRLEVGTIPGVCMTLHSIVPNEEWMPAAKERISLIERDQVADCSAWDTGDGVGRIEMGAPELLFCLWKVELNQSNQMEAKMVCVPQAVLLRLGALLGKMDLVGIAAKAGFSETSLRGKQMRVNGSTRPIREKFITICEETLKSTDHNFAAGLEIAFRSRNAAAWAASVPI